MSVNKDQVKGRAEEAEGKAKEVAGKAIGNKGLEARGNIEKNAGAMRAAVGDARSNLDKAMKKT